MDLQVQAGVPKVVVNYSRLGSISVKKNVQIP